MPRGLGRETVPSVESCPFKVALAKTLFTVEKEITIVRNNIKNKIDDFIIECYSYYYILYII